MKHSKHIIPYALYPLALQRKIAHTEDKTPMKNILTILLCFAATLANAKISITKLTCELRDGFVVTTTAPRLGWQMTAEDTQEKQTAYQIRVSSAITGKMVLDTKRIESSQSQLISVSLGNGFYTWQVRVWDKNGKPSAWSKKAKFAVQDNAAAFGNAQWVGAITKKDAKTPEGRIYTGRALQNAREQWNAADPLSRRSIYVAKTFTAKKKIRHAVMNVCGLGFSEVSINGEKIGDGEFSPLWSDYDKSVFYNTYDVTEQLVRCKQNAANIEVLLGNGFYNEQGGRYHKLRISFGPPTLKMCIHITYTDGTTEDIVTDHSWRYSPSELVFNSLYGGEDYDARVERSWHPVVIQEGPKGMLRPQMAPPVKVMEKYNPVSCDMLTAEERQKAEKIAKHVLPAGTFVLDMGQNLAGVPEVSVQGKPGQEFKIYVSETLTPEGACNQRMTGRQHYYSYTIKGTDVETYRPRFSYYGFRYIQIEGARLSDELAKSLGVDNNTESDESLPVITSIQSCFVHNSARKVSEFQCSNDLVNKTHELIDKATRSNMQSVFTDCPHREKLGWLEQDWLNGPGLFMNYDLTGFAAQTVQNIADAQRPNGSVPTTAPEYVVFEGPGMDVFAESPEWGGTFIMMPWMYYEQYGDDSLLKQYYPQMKKYVDYLASVDSCGILKQGLGDWYDYGDFRSGFSRNTSVPLVSTAHHYRWTHMMGQIAAHLGKQDDANELSARSEMIKKAWQKEFGLRKNGIGTDNLLRSQTGMAIALDLALIDTEDRQLVLDSLIADIERHGCRLTTGDVGNRYLYEVLCEENKQEVLYRMLNHYDVPGYGFQIKQGMTTLTEQWDPANGSSMNHFMMGQIDGFHFTSLAGINIHGSHVVFNPQPVKDMKWVKASTETPYGKVAIEWSQDANRKINAKYSVPIGMTCEYK